MSSQPALRSIALVGGHLPRQCGIATFTTDLRSAIAGEFPGTSCMVVAVNDRPGGHDYPECVRFAIEQNDPASYLRAANFLNLMQIEVLSLQHEFGIFGGAAGSHVLELLRRVRMPVVTTLHTVLEQPSPDQRAVLDEVIRLSDRVVLMGERGRAILESIHHAEPRRISVIPHGVIDVEFLDPGYFKHAFALEGRKVLLTFGLLSPNKGIEHAVAALPEIIRRHPDVVYLVAGATHPHLRASEGESYRESLQMLAAELGVESHLVFIDRFMSDDELGCVIGAADVYLTPYLFEQQISSGTLARAFGSGKAIVSTGYWHATELLAGGRGVLVEFRSAEAIAAAVTDLLDKPGRMTMMRREAYRAGRRMIWPEVARRYVECFDHACALRRPHRAGGGLPGAAIELPEADLSYLVRLCDSNGLLQHAVYNVPNLAEGYCTDDNARGFLVAVLAEELDECGAARSEVEWFANRCLAFLWNAFDPESGRFRNFMNHQRQWIERAGSEDSHARALWAAGSAVARTHDDGHRQVAAMLFVRGLPAVERFTSPRAWAFALLGINEFLLHCDGDRATLRMRALLLERLVAIRDAHATSAWRWFEPELSYDNGRIAQAMIVSAAATGDADALAGGLDSLRWLMEVQTAQAGHFSPIGCHGFWRCGGERARYDQQPLEADSMVSALLEAHTLTGDGWWWDAAQVCLRWYLGENDLGEPLYDMLTGGCRDALRQGRLNENQGAESTLAFVHSLILMKSAVRRRHPTRKCAV